MATAQHVRSPGAKRSAAAKSQTPSASMQPSIFRSAIQRFSSCACGGSCPRCKTKSGQADAPRAGPGPEHQANSAVTAPMIQRKPAVSSPGDRFELEADEIADRVMRTPEPAGSAPAGIQRKCAGCDDEIKPRAQIRRAPASDVQASPEVGAAVHAAEHGGAPLPQSARDFFEPRFGRDLRQVRVHTDSEAASGAEAVQARAYTFGRDIVFGAGQYAPSAAQGRHLLAHELAHVLQQNDGGTCIDRQADDARVTQLEPKPEQRTKGMPDRFFFDLDQSELRADVLAEAAERARLVTWAIAHEGQHVRLVGRASQEGLSSHNIDLARRRAATVRGILEEHGVIVDGTPQIDMTYSQRPVDYRFYRSVEAIVAGSTATSCSTFTQKEKDQDIANCETALKDAHERAVEIADAALARIEPNTDPSGSPGPDRDAVLNDRFNGIDRSRLLPNFRSIVARLGQINSASGHICNDRCAKGCERAASAGADGPLKLCASFYIPGFRGQTIDADERVFVVLHETTHSAAVPGSSPKQSVGIDMAYVITRLFSALTGSEAFQNDDSYVSAMLTLARDEGGAPAVIKAGGGAPVDTMKLKTPTGETGDRNLRARRAIGFAESWLNYATFWTPEAYDFVSTSLSTWNEPELGGLGHGMLELFAPAFKLRHPGTADFDDETKKTVKSYQTDVAGRGFATPPISRRSRTEDRTRIAGIYDRLERMQWRLMTPIAVDRASSGDGQWSSEAGLPGLGTTVELADDFFTSKNPIEQTRHVIRLMARAMPDTGATWVEAYVEIVDGVHQFRGLGPTP
jgi:outer membrane protein OmpA-like peptidoglycan-associated protein